MVIIDTSVWISHLREGNNHLKDLLKDAEVACHPFIIGELACGNIRNRKEILSLLQDLPQAPELTQRELLYFVERKRLMGLDLGFVDVNLLAAARLSGFPLWTLDRNLKAAAIKIKVAYK